MFQKTFIKTDRACGATTSLISALFEELEKNSGSFGLYLAPYGEVSDCVNLVRDRHVVQVSRNTVQLPNQSVLKFAVFREGWPCSTRALNEINFNDVASCEIAFDIIVFDEYNYLPKEAINSILDITTHRPNTKLFRAYAFDRTDEEVVVLLKEPFRSLTVHPMEPKLEKERRQILAKHV